MPALRGAIVAASVDIGRYAFGDGYMPFGIPDLRELIACRYTAAGVVTNAREILITSGAQHALTLVISELSRPGDRIAVECPTYPVALDAIRACRRTPVPVGFNDESPTEGTEMILSWDQTLLGETLRQTRPSLAYVIPDFQNPTGSLMDTRMRERVVAAARRTDTRLIVDEAFRDLPFSSCSALPPPVAALDPARVVSIGSMSKAFWGGLRVGWVRATSDVIQRVTAARAISDMAGSVLDQLVALELLSSSEETLQRRSSQLEGSSRIVLAALERELPTWRATHPAGGASLWVRTPRPMATEIAAISPSFGLRVEPGPRFGPDGTMNSFIRLPFTKPAQEIKDGIARLAVAAQRLE
jgi:DNA-binding transcriptional MocR family regulator